MADGPGQPAGIRDGGSRRVVIDRFGPPAVVTVVTDPAPADPGPGEILVRVEASTVNGTDVVIRKGLYPLLETGPPLTLGYDLVGRIESLGDGVPGPAPGTRVAVITTVGGNADHAVVPAAAALEVPIDLDAVDLAPLTLSYLTAYQMVHHDLGVLAGQRILVHGGSGGVGTAAVQLARHRGAEVVATASPTKLDHLVRQGAVAVSHRDPDLWGRLRQESRRDGRDGFDGIVDPVGAASVGRSLRLLAPGGTVAAYSTVAAATRIPQRTRWSFLRFGAGYGALQARLAVARMLPGSRRAAFYGVRDSTRDHPDRHREDLAHLVDLLRRGDIAPVTTVLPLDEARRAHELHDAGEVVGQLVLVTGG
jgi:NADPH2:quinone reductase